MAASWLPPDWRGRRRIEHPVNWARLPEFDVGIACVQTRKDYGHDNRWYLYIRRFNEADIQSTPVLAESIITSTPGTTQTITSPADWNNTNNSIEVIGGGCRGCRGASTSTSGGGGGGGAYSKIINATITTPGTTQYYARVGIAGAADGAGGGDSWWTLTGPGTTYPASGTAVGAKGGPAQTSATSAPGQGGGQGASGYASPATGSVKTSGGASGSAFASNASAGGGGGAGGAAGNGGTGANATASGASGAGGAGNANTAGGGTGGTANPVGAGGRGSNISATGPTGSGGGGGGGRTSASTGGAGGLYGGGSGGGGRSTGAGGVPGQGVVVLTYTPVVPEPEGTFDATEAADDAAFDNALVGLIGTLSTTDPIDDATFDARADPVGTLAATEGVDDPTFSGSVFTVVTGTLGATEGVDDPTFAGRVDPVGVLAGTDNPDTASFDGDVTTVVANDGSFAAYDSAVYELLLHTDGADGTTLFPDSGGKNNTVTAHGVAQVDTQSVFAAQALQLTTGADYLTLDTGDYAFGTKDFCVDMRARISTAYEIVNFYDGGSTGPSIVYDGGLIFESEGGTITGGLLTPNTNYHVAMTRGSGLTRLWLNGAQQGGTLVDNTNYGVIPGYPRIGGAIIYPATFSVTEGSDTSSFTGNAAAYGTLGVTEASDTVAISGLVGRSGTILTTEGADTASITGTVRWLGTLGAIEASDTSSFTGLTAVLGTFAAPESLDQAVFTSPAPQGGTLDATEATTDVAAISGLVGRSGTLGVTESSDAVVITGAVRWLGTVGAIEASDTTAFTGLAGLLGTFSATETQDLASFLGPVPLTGTMAVTEGADVVAVSGTVGLIGALAVTDVTDTASISGLVGLTGTFAATDVTDTPAFAGLVRWIVTLSATEAPDVVAINGLVGRSGTINAIEASDVVAVTGTVTWLGTLGATEASDVAVINGLVGRSGTLTAPEAADVVAINGLVGLTGTLAATEASDTAYFNAVSFVDLGQLGAGGSITTNQSSLTVATTANVAAGELLIVVVAVSQPTLTPRIGPRYGTDTVTIGGFSLTHAVGFQAADYSDPRNTTCSLFYGVTPNAIPAGSDIIATFLPGAAYIPDSSSLTARHFAVYISNVVLRGVNYTSRLSGIPPALDCASLDITALRVRGTSTTSLVNPDAPIPTAQWTGWQYGISRATYAPPGTVYHQYALAEHILFTGTSKVSQPTWIDSYNADVYAVFEVVPVQGQLDATEARDTTVFTGTAVTLGSFAVTEITDTAAMSGLVGLTGTLGATEGIDTAYITQGAKPHADSTIYTADNTNLKADNG